MRKIRPALLRYQRSWVYDRSRIKLCEKSRRIGITWATAGEAVTVAGTRDEHGGMDVWYMVNNEDDARDFIADCTDWAEVFEASCSEVQTTLIPDDDAGKRYILAFKIEFASGFRIHALSSNPRRLRGKQGYAILDEGAHHDNLDAFMKASLAFIMLGGRVAIISTHDGVDNPFNQLIVEERKRRKEGRGQRISLHRCTLDDALADGFYEEIVCRRNRSAIKTPEAHKAWRDRVVDDYGANADEELFANPESDGAKILWTPEVIDSNRWQGKIPSMHRIIVSVDPSGSDEKEGDACGIVAMGITGDNHIYVTHDRTTDAGPAVWALDSVNLYHEISADAMVAEKNYGGKMVRDLISLTERGESVEYMDVVAKTKKYKRAVPVAAMNRKNKIHLCGHFPELEAEMTTWREGLPSPNRLDALVQGCTELLWPNDENAGRDDIFFM